MGHGYLVVGIVGALALALPAHPQTSAFTPEQREQGEALVRVAAANLAKTARDPSSASFRNVFIQKRVTPTGEPLTLCGEVNARNGFGGFTGFQAFMLLGDAVQVGTSLGLPVAQLCKNRNPIIDTRDYAPEMQKAFAAALGG